MQMIRIVQNAEVQSIKLYGLKIGNILGCQNGALEEVRCVQSAEILKNQDEKMKVIARNVKVTHEKQLGPLIENAMGCAHLALGERKNAVYAAERKKFLQQGIAINVMLKKQEQEEKLKFWMKTLSQMNEKKLMNDIEMTQNLHLKSLSGLLPIDISRRDSWLDKNAKCAA